MTPITITGGELAMTAPCTSANRGQALRRTSALLPMSPCGAIISPSCTNVHIVSPASANSTYGTSCVCTDVTPENATVTAPSMPSGARINHSGPSAACLYFTRMSRAATIRVMRQDAQMSRTRRRRLTGR
jgi:hypothetical protein